MQFQLAILMFFNQWNILKQLFTYTSDGLPINGNWQLTSITDNITSDNNTAIN